MPRRFPPAIVCLCVALLLALAACSERASQPSAEAPGEATSTTGIQPVVFEPPGAGQRMLWIDASPVVYVPGGSFIMGQDEDEPSDHSPAHTVTLNPYWIYQAEVTNRMYQTCVELGVCTEPTQSLWFGDPEYENAPVSGVDWTQAEAYCEWMNGRLPTEAEWELAARGTEGDPYPWGEDEPTCDLLNFLDCLIPSVPDAVRSYPLGASEYNLADMAGNISEWVADWYGEDYYAASPGSNPLGPTEGEDKVVRGSSYLSPVEDTLIYLRSSQNPLQSQPTIGFRCVLNGEGLINPPPMCSVVSYDPSWPMAEVPEPTAESGHFTSMSFYCNDPGYFFPLVAVIMSDFDIPPLLDQITSQSPPLQLPEIQYTVSWPQPTRLEATGTAVQPGQPLTVTWCFESETPQQAEAACPYLYTYNPATALCEYDLGYGGGQCPGGIVVEGYGCLPSPVGGQCPAAYYNAAYMGEPVCVPVEGPPPESGHPPAVCPQGLVFNEGDLCCDYPPDVAPICPVGFFLDQQSGICAAGFEWCASISNVAPLCEPTEEPPLHSCSFWTNEPDCTNALCEWVTVAGGPGDYCQ